MPENSASARCSAASSISSSVATAMAASALQHVVQTRQVELDRQRLRRSAGADREARARAAPLDVLRANVGPLADAVGHDAPAELRDQLARVSSSLHSTASP